MIGRDNDTTLMYITQICHLDLNLNQPNTLRSHYPKKSNTSMLFLKDVLRKIIIS